MDMQMNAELANWFINTLIKLSFWDPCSYSLPNVALSLSVNSHLWWKNNYSLRRLFAWNRKESKITHKSYFQSVGILFSHMLWLSVPNTLRNMVAWNNSSYWLGSWSWTGRDEQHHAPAAGVAWLEAGEPPSKMAGTLTLALSWKLSWGRGPGLQFLSKHVSLYPCLGVLAA